MTTNQSLWFNHGEPWTPDHVDTLKRFFETNPISCATIAHMARKLGRKPDALVSKMRGLSIAISIGDQVALARDSRKRLSVADIQNLVEMTLESFNRKYPPDLLDVVEVAPPPVPSLKPDDRVLYLCHNASGKMTAASFDWREVAAIGYDTKKVVDMNHEWRPMWEALCPEEQTMIKAAVLEGKV